MKKILIYIWFICLATQDVVADVNTFSQGIEVATAALRAPAVILSKKALYDKKIKKAYILGAVADFMRLSNDVFALYNLCSKNDPHLYKWTKGMWIGQDLASLFVKIKRMNSKNSSKWKNIESEYEAKFNKQISEFLKKLDVYILPTIEGAAAMVVALDSGDTDSVLNSISLPMQAVISGSRLLCEMIEVESGSMEQKLVILKTVIHALALIFQTKSPECGNPDDSKRVDDDGSDDEDDVPLIDRRKFRQHDPADPVDAGDKSEDSTSGKSDDVKAAPAETDTHDIPEVPEIVHVDKPLTRQDLEDDGWGFFDKQSEHEFAGKDNEIPVIAIQPEVAPQPEKENSCRDLIVVPNLRPAAQDESKTKYVLEPRAVEFMKSAQRQELFGQNIVVEQEKRADDDRVEEETPEDATNSLVDFSQNDGQEVVPEIEKIKYAGVPEKTDKKVTAKKRYFFRKRGHIGRVCFCGKRYDASFGTVSLADDDSDCEYK